MAGSFPVAHRSQLPCRCRRPGCADTAAAANGTLLRHLGGSWHAAGVEHTTLQRARDGDEQAFRELTEPYRRELQLHCYRMLGSMQDAEDALQETLLAAWRGLDGFEERASLRAWLYRIATNRCLNVLRDSSRRPQEVRPLPFVPPSPTRYGEALWLEPYPDVLLEALADTAPGPEARYETREAVGLAFVTALQQLPPRQRAALVLRDVLGFRAAEVAEMLESSQAAVKAALQRARATIEQRLPADGREQAPLPHSARERDLVALFAAAVERGDIEAALSLLTNDARLTMPPQPLEYQGRDAIAAFLYHRAELRGTPLRVVPTQANTQPALGYYLPHAHAPIARPYGLLVLTLEGDAIATITWFADTAVFPHFRLPPTLPTS
jgi:RNA polymerase sigma-70 factor (TIGR02960 family)